MTSMLLKLWRRKKAALSALISILIITLIITSIAITFAITVAFFRSRGELIISNYMFSDTNGNKYADSLTTTIRNIGRHKVELNNISITKDNTPVNWTLNTIPAIIDQTSQLNVICSTNNYIGELGYGQYIIVTYIYEEVKTLSIKIKMPAVFGRFDIIYQEDFSYGFSANWKHTLFMAHSSLGKHNIEDWIIMEENGNNFLHCLNKDCQLLILEDPLYNFYDTNITYDLLTNDDNANGIIFRYDSSGEYDKFYIVWYTTSHPSPVNGPHIDEINYFKWNITSDQIEPDKITAHYVEQNEDGWSWHRLADVDWIREDNKWYTWRIIANGTNMALYIDNEEFPTLEWNDMRIDHGFLGLINFFNIDLYYDNIYAWSTDI